MNRVAETGVGVWSKKLVGVSTVMMTTSQTGALTSGGVRLKPVGVKILKLL